MKLNLPNKITLVRIILLPLFVFFYLAEFIVWGKLIAALVFVIATTTDFIDGHIARKRNLVTNLGKFLDPIADKLIAAAALILIAIDGTLPSPYGAIVAIIIIGRELIISGFRQVAAANGIVISADKWGKIKTVFQDIAIPALMVVAQLNVLEVSNKTVMTIFEVLAFSLTLIATILTVVSALNYMQKNKQVFNKE